MGFFGLLAAGDAAERVLPQWDNWLSSGRDYTAVYILVAVLLLGYVLYRFRGILESKERVIESKVRVRTRCRDAGLNEREEEALVAAIDSANIAAPESAVGSEVYYNEFVAPILTRIHGAALRESIREKLFPTEDEKAGESEDLQKRGTHALNSGTRLQITFQQALEPVVASVVRVEPMSFVVAFPADEGNQFPIAKFDRVEGTYSAPDQGMIAFTSEVRDVVMGRMIACRIEHTESARLLRRRGDPRVPAHRTVRFHHLPEHKLGGADRVELSVIGSSFSDVHEGALVDISLGGCMLTTSDHDFEPGDLIEFHIPVREGLPPLEYLGAIVNVSETETGRIRLHLSFLGLDDLARHAIALLVARHGEAETNKTSSPEEG